MATKRRLLRGSYENIIKTYEGASQELKDEGKTWYPEAHLIAKSVGGIALSPNITEQRQVLLGAGIISAFSPQMVWEKNIRAAMVFAGTGNKPVWITNRDYDKACKMMKCIMRNLDATPEDILEILGDGAVKTRPFFMNILNPSGEVKENGITIDRHAIAIYLGDVPSPLQVGRASSKNGNTQIQNSYKIASQKLGVHHNDLQATTWLEWRINKDKYVQN